MEHINSVCNKEKDKLNTYLFLLCLQLSVFKKIEILLYYDHFETLRTVDYFVYSMLSYSHFWFTMFEQNYPHFSPDFLTISVAS